jgi:DNA polymerase IIIc chi subunit
MQHADKLELDWDEAGLVLSIETDDGDNHTFVVTDNAEKLAYLVDSRITPWLQERAEACLQYRSMRRLGFKLNHDGVWVREEDEEEISGPTTVAT